MVDPDDGTNVGTLLIYINGKLVAEGPTGIPIQSNLYGVIDLAGNCIAVSVNMAPALPGGRSGPPAPG